MPNVTSVLGSRSTRANPWATICRNWSTGSIRWSAVKTANTASGSWAASTAAVSPTAFSVSRPSGSPRNRCGSKFRQGGEDRIAVRLPGADVAPLGAISPSSRSKAKRSRLLPPIKGISCLGSAPRLIGHSRVPDPPAMMTAYCMETPSTGKRQTAGSRRPLAFAIALVPRARPETPGTPCSRRCR